MNLIKCISRPAGEYITAGEVYSYVVRPDGSVEYRKTDGSGSGSWMKKFFFEKAIKDGQIVVL